LLNELGHVLDVVVVAELVFGFEFHEDRVLHVGGWGPDRSH
jgi:hypothetical protein